MAKQTKQGVELSRGKETRSLINEFNVHLQHMGQPDYLKAMRQALVSYRSLDADSQALAFVVFVQWVNFYERTMYAHESGLVPEPVEQALRAYVVAFLITPGGREFWEDLGHVFGADVGARLTSFIVDADALPPPITETYPWLQAGGALPDA